MDISATGPAGETRRRIGVTSDAIPSARRHVAGVRRDALRTLRALAGE